MKEYTGIDLFSGAGGLSIGAEMAGISVKHAIEFNESAAKSYIRNHPHASMKCEDIRKIDAKEYAGTPVFIIMGGPPCQGFSMANTMTRNMDNPNNAMFREFVRFVRDIRPQWFLFENVWGLTNIEGGKTEEYIESEFRNIPGYKNIKTAILWASDYGVPQRRNRFFMVGNRLGIDFEFPKPISSSVTVGDAISDLPILANGDSFDMLPYSLPLEKSSEYAKLMRRGSDCSTQNFVSRNNDLVIERYKYIKQGQNWSAIPEPLMGNYADKGRCHSNIYRRLCEDKPSVVISNYRKSMIIHPTQDRGLSVREAARIQSFPDSYVFEGPISHIQQQIGNAVPPLLAKAVIEKILSYNK